MKFFQASIAAAGSRQSGEANGRGLGIGNTVQSMSDGCAAGHRADRLDTSRRRVRCRSDRAILDCQRRGFWGTYSNGGVARPDRDLFQHQLFVFRVEKFPSKFRKAHSR